MGENTATARAEAIEGFADVLSQLRDSVGKPSFRAMAGQSKVISHTTLHEAVQGNRLPSWGTTTEFVKACGAHPGDYRGRWEQANRRLSLLGGACPVSAIAPPAVSPTSAVPGATPRAPTTPGRRRLQAVLGVVAVAVIATGAGVAWSVSGDDEPASDPPPLYAAADCPVHQKNPPPAVPEHEGDRAAFVADITLPDCAHVQRGQTVEKIWRLKNTGKVAWAGYMLHRVDLPQGRDQCQTISDVPIADTRPGQVVDVKAEITVPTSAGFCFVRFKMSDAGGKVAFPGSRPVNFQVVVD